MERERSSDEIGSHFHAQGRGATSSSVDFSQLSAGVTHNHPEGIKGAKAVAEAFYGVPSVCEEKLMEALRPHGDLFEILFCFQRAIIA